MFAKFVMGLMAVLLALPAAAEPVTLSCKVKGSRASLYGRLLVVVDLAERSVQIEAPEKMPGVQWRYSNGKVAPILAQGPPWMIRKITPTTVPVAQFVNVAPRWVTLGWRDSDLSKHAEQFGWHGHLAEYDGARSFLQRPDRNKSGVTFSPAKASTDVVSKAAPMAIIDGTAFVALNLIIAFSFAALALRSFAPPS